MNRFVMPLLSHALLLSSSLPAQALAEDWIGLENESVTQLGYSYSLDQDDSDSHQLSLYHTPDSITHINLQYSQNNSVTDSGDFDYDDFQGQLRWTLDKNFQLGFSYQSQGKERELEISNIGILGSYTQFPYIFSMEYRSGSLSIYTRSNINNAQVPDRMDSDIDSYHYSFTWIREELDFYLNYQTYQYEKDLSPLDTSIVLQILVKPGVLVNSGLLLSSMASAGVTWYQNQHELSWFLSSANYEVDDSQTNSLQFDWRNQRQQFSIIYSAGITDDSQDNLSIGIGFEWNV